MKQIYLCEQYLFVEKSIIKFKLITSIVYKKIGLKNYLENLLKKFVEKFPSPITKFTITFLKTSSQKTLSVNKESYP